MRRIINFPILSLLSILNITLSSEYNCFAYNNDYRCRLGTITPYRFIANYDDSPFVYSGCTEKKIWLTVRHGTRYPGKKYLPLMIRQLPELQATILENYKKNKTDLVPEDVALLADWKLGFDEEDIMKLAEEGENEMLDLGERFQSRFSSLMPEKYDNQTYKFKYTATQRTKESARHFAAGLFGWHNSKNVLYPEPEHADRILRFYKGCLRWLIEVDENPNALEEKQKFLQSEIFNKTLQGISIRIAYPVNYESARMIYRICGFETAWDNRIESPWCKLLSLHDFKVLEFAEDLDYYWVDGYGYKLTYEQACPALRDMFDFFESPEHPIVSAYFTHSGTILKLLALLGIAKEDNILRHDLFHSHIDHRAWRTGLIDTFASNIAFVLYDCETKGPSVLFLHQERPVYLPGCPLNIPCPLSIMKALYPDHESECQFEAMCSITKNESEKI